MKRLIRTELLKQRTTRASVASVAAVALVTALITVAVLSTAGRDGNDPLGPESLARVIGAPAGVIIVIALMLGVVGMAGEYRHRTITTTLLATPRRRDVIVSKAVAYSLTGALMALLSLGVSVSIALPWLHSKGIALQIDGQVARVTAGLVVSTALYGALGVSIGALIRNQTAAAGAALVWLLAIEGLLRDTFHRYAFVRWLPAEAGRALVHVGPNDGLTSPVAACVFVAYVAVLAIAAVRFTLHRDVN